MNLHKTLVQQHGQLTHWGRVFKLLKYPVPGITVIQSKFTLVILKIHRKSLNACFELKFLVKTY